MPWRHSASPGGTGADTHRGSRDRVQRPGPNNAGMSFINMRLSCHCKGRRSKTNDEVTDSIELSGISYSRRSTPPFIQAEAKPTTVRRSRVDRSRSFAARLLGGHNTVFALFPASESCRPVSFRVFHFVTGRDSARGDKSSFSLSLHSSDRSRRPDKHGMDVGRRSSRVGAIGWACSAVLALICPSVVVPATS